MTHLENHMEEAYSKTVFGFWIYLLTDFILFGVLFAVYVVLRKSTFGGPSSQDLFIIPYNLFQTLVLLASAFTIGIAGASLHRHHKKPALLFLIISFILGLIFFGMMVIEFSHLYHSGNGWNQSAFLSAYFTLVGTLGVHVIFGLLWMVLYFYQIIKHEIDLKLLQRVTCLRMFWQFINLVWGFIFMIVYLLGEV